MSDAKNPFAEPPVDERDVRIEALQDDINRLKKKEKERDARIEALQEENSRLRSQEKAQNTQVLHMRTYMEYIETACEPIRTQLQEAYPNRNFEKVDLPFFQSLPTWFDEITNTAQADVVAPGPDIDEYEQIIDSLKVRNTQLQESVDNAAQTYEQNFQQRYGWTRLQRQCKELAAENDRLRQELRVKEENITKVQLEGTLDKQVLAETQDKLAESELLARKHEKVTMSLSALADCCNDGDPGNSGMDGIAKWVDENRFVTGPWFDWAYRVMHCAFKHGWRGKDNQSSTTTEQQASEEDTEMEDTTASSGPAHAPAVPETRATKATPATTEISKPKEDPKMWPWNNDPNPGREPTAFDLYYGQFVEDKDCKKWEPNEVDDIPRIPNKGVVSYKKNGSRYKDCAGNTNWTDSRTVCKNINFKNPDKVWFIRRDGVKVYRWNTESRTRSRTLKYYQTLPPNIDFNKAGMLRDGAMYSCVSRSHKHKQQIPIFAFGQGACVLCKQGPPSGQCFPHDFRYTGPKRKSELPVYVDPWPLRMQAKYPMPARKEAEEEEEEEEEM